MAVQEDVRRFLTAWIVDRNIELAMQSFGAGALQNEMMLSDSCAGYIKTSERKAESSRRAGMVKFLRDFFPEPPVGSLNDALNRQAAIRVGTQMKQLVVNVPDTDFFVLAKIGKGQIPSSSAETIRYLRDLLPADLYVTFIPIGPGAVYFLWVPEGTHWKVMHASLVCQ